MERDAPRARCAHRAEPIDPPYLPAIHENPGTRTYPTDLFMAVWWLTLANNMESIMSSKILAGAAALALTTVLVTAGPASAQNWGCYNACYPNYAYAPAYNYAPLYGNYGGYYDSRWSYRGGPHPSTGHL